VEELKYVIEDRTIAEVLGVQNFNNKESAILEIIKNSYDAHASLVSINILNDEIIITDNGCGMNEYDIRMYWMHIGVSSKDYQLNGRIMSGSKGVGRFALARLGECIEIVTQSNSEDHAIKWSTDWNSSRMTILNERHSSGTSIRISGLRDKWNKSSADQLKDYLSRTYRDTLMRVEICIKDAVLDVTPYFGEMNVGNEYVSKIDLRYESNKRMLFCDINSDEFIKDAQNYCDINISTFTAAINMKLELKSYVNLHTTEEELSEMLLKLGNFECNLYFSNVPVKADMAKFFYKYSMSMSNRKSGIVLYRNAFSISSYEGRRDWLGLDKRVRKSPAAATHPTGSWHVRENQIAGQVIIDRQNNSVLRDLSNRQGMEENEYYWLFLAVIESGLACFERYRQSIIRSIDKKNKLSQTNDSSTIINEVLAKPGILSSIQARDEFIKELKNYTQTASNQKNDWREAETRYKYDVRILNTLSTLGLRAASIAHEMRNDRNSISSSYDDIVSALVTLNLWDFLNQPENISYKYLNVPSMLLDTKKVNNKVLSFMDVMLTQIEKQQFVARDLLVCDVIAEIEEQWTKHYAWINFDSLADRSLRFWVSEDVIKVIFDNMILNSVQQNSLSSKLIITIECSLSDNGLLFKYSDNGVGLDNKYVNDPRRILDVHETSRKDGHGLGMWIVNNTINMTGGEIVSIAGKNGFSMEFILGRKNM